MKKSKKITGVLLACCALLMVAIAGLGVTMAKYIKTETHKPDSAKVAAFGVTMEWNGDFAKSYATDDAGETTITNSVVSSNKVVAPGTTGTITLELGGTSEVAFTLDVSIVEEYSQGNWKNKAENGTEYHPITYTVTSTAKVGETAISVENDNKTIKPVNVAPGVALSGTITITWSWPFTGDDAADTYMSSVADATYTISATSTATQID